MSFTAVGPYNYSQMPSRPQRPLPQQKPPGFFDEFATGAGKGFGESVQKQIADRLESSALDRALGRLSPEMSVLEQHRALASQSPESRAYFNANVAPQMQKEQTHTVKRNQSSALAGLLSGGGQGGGVTGVSTLPQNQESIATPQQRQQSKSINDLSPEQLNAVYSTLDPTQQIQFAKLVEDRKKADLGEREFANKERVRKIESQEKISTPIIQASHEARHATQARAHAADEMIAATQSGNLGLGQDYLAELVNAENLRTPQGARFKSAQKEALLSGINRIPGGRPNMWIEQQVGAAIPQIGRSKEGNLISGLAMKAGADTDQMYIDELDNLSEQYRNDPNFGYVPANIEAQVMKNIAPRVKQRQDLLAYQMRRVHEQENPKSLLSLKKVPPGTPLTLKKAEFFIQKANGNVDAAEQMAIQRGYTIPADDIIEQGE